MMWKDIKKKWMDWFQAEETDQTDEAPPSYRQTHERHETNAKTKMTYKYPKQGEFRFPVIPDQSPKRNRRPSPAFQPNQDEQPARKGERRKPKETADEQTTSTPTEEKEHRELPETSSVPFTPTDVPSPIYGYHEREMKARVEELEDAVSATHEEETAFENDQEWEMLRARLRDRMNSKREPFTVEAEAPAQEVESQWSVENESYGEVVKDSDWTEAEVMMEEADEESNSPSSENSLEFDQTIGGHEQTDEESSDSVVEELEMEMEEPEVIHCENESSAVEELEHDSQLLVNNEESVELPGDEMEDSEPETSIEEDVRDEEEWTTNNLEESGPDSIEEVETTFDTAVSSDDDRVEEATSVEPEDKTKKRTVPFNVIMTPRDKRTRDQKSEPLKSNHLSSEEEAKSDEIELQEEKKERIPYRTPMHLLDDATRPTNEDDTWIEEQMNLLETTLRHFHVKAKVVNAMKGPSVTRFEVQPEPGVKVSKITNLSDDIKLSMAARDIRIEAPIPGKQAVGIEVPNHQSQMVGLQEIFESESFVSEPSPLSVGLGLDIGGDPIVTNLKKMPHGLIAGATGSGKSVCINTILVSLLYKAHYEDVKFLLIDPKMVELAPYNELPHLVSPVITDVKAATTALKWAVKEMEERYEKFVEEGVRDVERYNDKMIKHHREDEKLPYLVIVIDELADLMMVSPQDVEDAICRIAQKARACGIHLLLATQRPSVDVITGLIKANIPTRIAFSVSSQVDSRTIIDTSGAEKLLGKGDMLFVENGSGQARRIQGAFVSDDEIERVTSYVKRMAPPQYLFHQEELMKQISSEEETDELFEEAVRFVLQHNGASASLIQRRFKVGYNRAARLIDQMEDYGIISEQKGSKPRDILMSEQQIEELMNA